MRIRLKHRELARILERGKLTQNHWALRLGISKGHLSLLVNGKRPYPSGRTRERLLRGLDVDFDRLFAVEVRPPVAGRREKWTFGRSFGIRPPASSSRKTMLLNIWPDIRYALRVLRRTPGITLVAVLILAIGVGANGAIFSFADALLLSQPNLPQPDRLVRVFSLLPDGTRYGTFSYPEYRELRRRSRSFQGMAAHSLITFSLATGQDPEVRRGEVVSGNFFEILGVRPLLGRGLSPADDQIEGGHPVVVISESLWETRFGSSPDILGRTVFINTHAFEVVGVMPSSFRGSYDIFTSDLWAPLAMYEQVRPRGLSRERWGWGWLNITGRLAPDATLESAGTSIDTAVATITQDFPSEAAALAVQLVPAAAIPEQFREGTRNLFVFVMAVSGLLLLVACANVASLLLARVSARGREIAVRKAMGAGRWQLMRQFLTESILLALVIGPAALPVTLLTQQALLWARPPTEQFAAFSPDLSFNWTLVAFTFLVALGASVAFGLVPAMQAARAEVASAVKGGASSATSSRSRLRWQGGLVVAQVCFSLVLVTVAGLLLRDLSMAESLDPGFAADKLLLAEIDFQRHGYDEIRTRTFLRDLRERLKAQPGVEAVSVASIVPLEGSSDRMGVRIPGHQPPEGRTSIPIAVNSVGADYFKTMGIPLMEGRAHATTPPPPGSAPSIVINETMAKLYWPDESALGKRITFAGQEIEAEVVGVASDAKYSSLAESPRPFIYMPFQLAYFAYLTVHVRTADDPAQMRGLLRQELRALDARLAPNQLITFNELRQMPFFLNRAMAAITTAFGLLTLCLTAIGLYGMVSYSVSRRTREIGIRVALGADRGRILQLVLRGGMLHVGAGILAGLILAFFLTSLLSSLIVFAGVLDPPAFLAAVLLSLGVGLAASLLPALRAIHVDPIQALRYE
ncbi:MAG TPA: ADOP family duplicated permease [Acidobacteriota bacterium]|nr:ADOP family duplicated permease [Acidobacteriota bacterium]